MINILKKALDNKEREIWNDWKHLQTKHELIFKNINFNELNAFRIRRYDLSNITFINCTFIDMQFHECNFSNSMFFNCLIEGTESTITYCNFRESEFYYSTIKQAALSNSILSNCEFDHCQLSNLDFYQASLIKSKFVDSSIKRCKIFGANVWSIDMTRTTQCDLIMPYNGTDKTEEINQISIDDIELGNVVYLLAANSNITKLINQSKSNFVLILGRFGDNIKRLNSIKSELRHRDLSPIVFDFKGPDTLDLIEMIILLALLSKFIIVDLSEPKSVPAELQAILSNLMIPVAPILDRKSSVYSTYSFTNRYNWVLPVLVFDDIDEIIKGFKKGIIDPANEIYDQISALKSKNVGSREAKDFYSDEAEA